MYKNLFVAFYKKLLGDRYGIDDLAKLQFYFLLLLVIVDIFVDSYIVGLLQLITMIIMIYRFMSKNIFKRLKENEKYCDIRYAIFKPFKNIKRNLVDKKHIYKKCKCGTTIKMPLPKKWGLKHTTCPNCGKRLKFITLKKKK